MKRLLLAICAAVALSSCATSTYYQMYSVASDSAQTTSNGSLFFKTNDGLVFTYNFWGESGNLRFIVYNSNDYDVIVDMTRSSFIRNGIAEDYFTDKKIEHRFITGVLSSSKKGVSVSTHKIRGGVDGSVLDNYLGHSHDVILAIGAETTGKSLNKEFGSSAKKEWQTAVVYKEPMIVRIPAKSAKAFCSFNINHSLIASLPRATSFYKPTEYTKENSPLIMRNRLCVYKDGEVGHTFHDMDFYINGIDNITTLTLSKPTLFYNSYPNTIENEFTIDNDFTGKKDSKYSNKSFTLKGKTYKIGDSVEWNGKLATVKEIFNNQVILAIETNKEGSWYDAMEFCQTLGKGWRLPTIREFNAIKYKIDMNSYWTLEEINDSNAHAFSVSDNKSFSTIKHRVFKILPINIINMDELKE